MGYMRYTHMHVYVCYVYICRYQIPLNTSLALPKGFWTLELELTAISEDLDSVKLKYKEEGLPPYPLAIPNKASFHCSNATYCVEDEADRSRCNKDMPRVIIRSLQVHVHMLYCIMENY